MSITSGNSVMERSTCRALKPLPAATRESLGSDSPLYALGKLSPLEQVSCLLLSELRRNPRCFQLSGDKLDHSSVIDLSHQTSLQEG